MEPGPPNQDRTRLTTYPENQYDSDAASVPDEEDEIDDRLFFLRETLGMQHVHFMVFAPVVVLDEPTERHNFVPVDETGTRTAQEGEDECCVCRINLPDAVIMPCSHTGVCCVCANQIGRTTGICPLCRAGNITVSRVGGVSAHK